MYQEIRAAPVHDCRIFLITTACIIDPEPCSGNGVTFDGLVCDLAVAPDLAIGNVIPLALILRVIGKAGKVGTKCASMYQELPAFFFTAVLNSVGVLVYYTAGHHI